MSEERPELVKELPLEWHIPDQLPCQYATNIVAQHTEHEFIVSFFRASPPIILGPLEDAHERLDQLEAISAECVARVVIAPGRMAEFIEVLQMNLERWQARELDA